MKTKLSILCAALVLMFLFSAPTGSQDIQSIGEVGDLLVQYGLVRVIVAGDTLYLYADKVLADSARFGSLKVTGTTDLVGVVRLRSSVVDDTVKVALGIRNEGPLRQKGAVLISPAGGYGGTPLSLLHINATAIGATADTTKALRLTNTTPAAAGAQQVSPGLLFQSYGWKTDATAGPQWTQWNIYNLPVQGTSAPTTKLMFDSKVGSGSWTNRAYFLSDGSLYTGTFNSSTGSIQTTAVGGITLNCQNAAGYIRFLTGGESEKMRLLANGKLGLGTTTPLNSFSLVDATSGQGTGIHVVSSQWNKARSTWAAAHDTSSIMQYIDSAGGPRLSLKAVDGDSLGITIDGSTVKFNSMSTNSLAFYVGTSYLEWNGNAVLFANDTKAIGGTGNKIQNYYGSDNIYLGGKSQTATMYISGENTIAGTDSSLILSAASGIPTITAMHTGSFTNGGRRFYTGADTLGLFNGAKTGRDSTFFILQTGGTRTTGMYGNNSEQAVTVAASATTFAVLKNNVAVTGDAGGNTVATITGGGAIGLYTFRFVDDKITITDTGDGTANTVNLSGAFTSSANDIMTLYWNGTSWYEASRSVN